MLTLTLGVHPARRAQGLCKEIQVGRQQGIALIALNVFGAEFTGPKLFLPCLENHLLLPVLPNLCHELL